MAKRGRLSDTAALPATRLREGESVSKEVRKIDNGYLHRETICGPGKYETIERFSNSPKSNGTRGTVGDESFAGARREFEK